jgi:hypothetical protein
MSKKGWWTSISVSMETETEGHLNFLDIKPVDLPN